MLNAVGDAIVLLLMCEPFATLFTLGTCVVYEIAQKNDPAKKSHEQCGRYTQSEDNML